MGISMDYFKNRLSRFFCLFKLIIILGDMMQTILITGAASGLAKNVIDKIKDNEYFIFLTVRTNKQLEKVKEKYKNYKNIKCLKLDITNKQDLDKVKELDIDILINNAANGEGGSVLTIPIKRLEKNFDTNVFGTVALTQIVLQKMLQKDSGKIINIASLAGVMPISFLGSYSATKASIIKLSIVLRNELKLLTDNIKIVLIEPGFYHTGFNQVMLENKYNDYRTYFDDCIELIKARENLMLRLLEHKNFNSITYKIIKAIKLDNPHFIYRAPFWQSIGSKIYELFH